MKKAFCFKCISTLLAFCMMQGAWADFVVRDTVKTVYENNDCKEKLVIRACDDNPCYGNGQVLKFREAVGNCSLLSIEEENALAAELPIREFKRYYGRIRVNRSALSLTRIRNRSTDANANLTVADFHASTTQTGLELAFGYIWDPTFWGDIEYLVLRNFDVPARPLFIGSPFVFPFTLKTNVLLANVYYTFTGFSRFEPYVTGGIGASMFSARPNGTPPGVFVSTQSYGFVIGGGVGLRIGFFSRWYVDTAYRFLYLGQFNIKPTNNPNIYTRLTADVNMSVFSIGLIYLF